MESSELLQTLEQMAKGNDIKAAVAREALDYHTPVDFFRDLQDNGCASGMVTSLIYFHDTHAFYDQHYAEIEELREEWQFNMGTAIEIKGDLKNWFAWFAFEETAYQLATDMGLL